MNFVCCTPGRWQTAPPHTCKMYYCFTETTFVICHVNARGRWTAVIFVSSREVSRGSREHSVYVHVFVCVYEARGEERRREKRREEEGAAFIWPRGAMGFLLIGLVQWPGANRREKYCEKNPKRHFCLSWDIWHRNCEPSECSSGGSKRWECEKENWRETEGKRCMFPRINVVSPNGVKKSQRTHLLW